MQPYSSISNSPTADEIAEQNERRLEIYRGWSKTERIRRQFAIVDRAVDGGLRFPRAGSVGRVEIKKCHVIVSRKSIEDDVTHADCPYWMTEILPEPWQIG